MTKEAETGGSASNGDTNTSTRQLLFVPADPLAVAVRLRLFSGPRISRWVWGYLDRRRPCQALHTLKLVAECDAFPRIRGAIAKGVGWSNAGQDMAFGSVAWGYLARELRCVNRLFFSSGEDARKVWLTLVLMKVGKKTFSRRTSIKERQRMVDGILFLDSM